MLQRTKILFCGLLLAAVPAADAAELALKSLANTEADADAAAGRKYGPFVEIGGGATFGQSGNVSAGTRNFSLDDTDGSAIFSVEVGKSWKMKRWPLMGSFSFEGTYMGTNISGRSPDAATAATAKNGGAFNDTDLVAYEGDMNSLMLSLNASVALDLYRYRARIGKFLAGFRPYVGGGIGGGQVWFRNIRNISRDQFQGGTGFDAVSDSAGQSIFVIDEFVNSWNWYAGLEWTWKDKYSVFAEYHDYHFGDMDNLTNFETDGYLVGFRYRY